MNYDKNLGYNVKIKWDKSTGGVVELDNFNNIMIDTPIGFNGRGMAPCPDQLFLASIGGCLLNTFTHYTRRFNLIIKDVAVSVDASLSLNNEGYRFDNISAELSIQVSDDSQEVAERCGILAKNFCHITRTLESVVPINVNIIVNSKSLCINP